MVFGRSVAIRPPLYGTAHGCDNPGEYQHIDMGGARPQQRAGASIDGGPGSEHIVDQHQPATVAFSSAGTRKAPCTLSARSVLDRPTCCGVARTRLSAPCSTGLLQMSEIAPASAAD